MLNNWPLFGNEIWRKLKGADKKIIILLHTTLNANGIHLFLELMCKYNLFGVLTKSTSLYKWHLITCIILLDIQHQWLENAGLFG